MRTYLIEEFMRFLPLERYLKYTPVDVKYEDAKDVYEKVCYFYDEVMRWARKQKLI